MNEKQTSKSWEIVKEAMEHNDPKMSMRKLAAKSGVSLSSLSYWKNGQAIPEDRTARAVSHLLEIEFDRLRLHLEIERRNKVGEAADERFSIHTKDLNKSALVQWLPRARRELEGSKEADLAKMGIVAGGINNAAVPILGSVPGGEPVEVTPRTLNEANEYIALPMSELRGMEGMYALRVSGKSMSGRVDDGDLVVVDPDQAGQNGDVVVAYLDGEVTLKALEYANSSMILRSTDPDISVRVINMEEVGEFRILGKVVMRITKNP